jgi:hypothetical protein
MKISGVVRGFVFAAAAAVVVVAAAAASECDLLASWLPSSSLFDLDMVVLVVVAVKYDWRLICCYFRQLGE